MTTKELGTKYKWLRDIAPRGALVRSLTDRQIEDLDRLSRLTAKNMGLMDYQVRDVFFGFAEVEEPPPPKRLQPFFDRPLLELLSAKLELERNRAGTMLDNYEGAQYAWLLDMPDNALAVLNTDLNSNHEGSRNAARRLREELIAFLGVDT